MATKKQLTRAINSFDELDAAGIGAGYTPPKLAAPDQTEPTLEKSSAWRGVGDNALALGQGLVGGIKMLSDLAGPDNAVSQTLGQANKGMQKLYSPARMAEMGARQDAINQADESGSTMDQITSRLGGIAEAPLQTTLQAAGSMAPNIATAIATGGVSAGPGLVALAARIGVPAALGVGMGVGSVKGQNFEAVFQKAKQSGMDDDQATELAVKASEYSEQNAPQQALGGALGALDSMTGAERMISGMARREGGKQGFLKRSAMGGLQEAPPEGLQGAQGQYAQNEAMNNAGFQTDPWAGVAGQGVNDAVVGALVGAPVGAMNKPAKVAEVGPLSRAANTGIDATPSAEPPPADIPLMPGQEQALLDNANQRAQALADKASGTKDQKVNAPDGTPITIPGQPKQFLTPAEKEERDFLEQNGGDAQALSSAYPDLIQAPEVEQVPLTPIAEVEQVPEALPVAPTQAMEQVPPADPVEAARQQYRREQAALEAQAQQAEEDRINALIEQDKLQQAQPDDNFWAGNEPLVPDLMNPKGQPFKEKAAALAAAKRAGGGDVVPVTGGFVVRQKKGEPGSPSSKESNGTSPTDTPMAQGANEPASDQPGGSGVAALVQPASRPAGDIPGAPVADTRTGPGGSVPLTGGVPDAVAPSGTSATPASQENTGNKPVAPTQKAQVATESVAKQVIGKSIDKTWTAFHPDSGTLNIPRADMPQIKSEHRGAMTNFLNARGIESESDSVPASALKPTQMEFAPSKVEKAKAFDGNDRPVLVSSDGHVLDGHHQWLAKMGKGESVKVTRLNAPIVDLLTAMREFPSAGMTKDSEPATTTVAPANSNAWSVVGSQSRSMKNAVADAESLNKSDKDFEYRAAPTASGYAVERRPRANNTPAAPTGAPAGAAPAAESGASATAEQWTRMTQANRLALTTRTGMGKLVADKIARTAWADITPKTRARITEAMAAPAQATDVAQEGQKAPAAAVDQGDGINDSIRALRAKSFKTVKQGGPRGDVRLSTGGEYVSFDDAVAEARKAVASGVRPVPFQIHNALDVNIGETDRIIAALGEPMVKPVTPQVAPVAEAAPKKGVKAKIEEAQQARANHFTPGNIVASYGGHDEVLSYTPPGADGSGWRVKVQAVKKVDGEWVRIGKPQDARTHTTQPSDRELKAGPLAKVPAAAAGAVRYTEPRADGTPFPNADAQGVVEQVPGEVVKVATPPSITQADVDAATHQARQQIEQTIDGMKADAVQRIAHKFLPTMGVKTPIGKARIKAAMGESKVNVLAAAGELGIELPPSIKKVLEAKIEGRVDVTPASEKPADPNPEKAEAAPKELSTGDFGPILTQYHHDAQGAIKALTELQNGEAAAALQHPEVGDIDLVWGETGTGNQDGFGLAKLAAYHPEVLGDLQGFLNRLHKDPARSGKNRIRLVDASGEAAVSLNWKGDKKVWLLTAYEKGAGAGTTMNTSSISGKDDTTRLATGTVESVAQPVTEDKPATEAAQPKPAKIEDSGEVLEGARKLYAKNYAAKMDEGKGMDTAAVPLSKSWPEPDYQRLLDEGADPWAVAMAHAMRDEVPTKPSSWKLKGWVQKVEALRDMAADVMSGATTKEKFKTTGGQFNLADWFNKIDLYEAMGHAKSLKTLKFSMGEYGMYGGKTFSPAKKLWTINMPNTSNAATWGRGNWGTDLVVTDTKEEAIAKFKEWSEAQVEKAPAEAKATSFDIYSYRSKPGVFIVGKRISSTKSVDLKEFPTAKEAREYKAANQAELERLLAEAKFEPAERGESNAPRVGADHRNGADVTSEQFRDTFGFRGEQFGASMPQGERQANMNQAYDALMDLAGVIGIPPKALSLNGELGLAFGARGTGGKNPAAAHYERDITGAVTPNRVVINLTRKNGAGSLAHEWFHAADNYFARMRGEKAGMLTESFGSRGDGVRPEMVAAFKQLVTAIQVSGIKERSKQLDKKRVKDYWSTGLEMAARSFESYVIAKLQDGNGSNDYLANIVPESLYSLQGSYPYPVMGEMPAIRAAFDHFFDTVQTKETAQGMAMFSRGTSASAMPAQQVTAIVSAITARWGNAPQIVIAANMADTQIPQSVRDYDQKQKSLGATGEPEGFVHGGKVYLLANQLATPAEVMRVLFHESLGHMGLRGVFGDKLDGILKQLAGLRRADVAAKAAQYGLDMNIEDDRLQAAEEVLAELAQTKPELGYVKRAIGLIRGWLRANVPGFGGMKLTDSDIVAQFIVPARRFIEGNGELKGGNGALQSGTSATAQPAEIGTSAKNQAETGTGTLFSRSPIGQVVQSTQDALKNATVTDLLKQFGNRLTDFRGLALQALGRRQLVEIYGKDLPDMVRYSDMVAQMDADKNESGAEADALATDWGKLADERQLAELMHDATLAQFDASIDVDPADKRMSSPDLAEQVALMQRFKALSAGAKAAYLTARDMYADHNGKVRASIQDRIMRSELSPTKKAELFKRMDGEFFAKTKGVYFPLARFGRYVTIVKSRAGEVVSANRSETMNEAEATRKQLLRAFPPSGGFKVGKVLKDREFNAARDGVGRGFMADLFEALEGTGVDKELQDAISQLYLAALPDLSWAKHGIHRKGTPGFSQDARRAFAQNMFHGARYLAKLRYADRLQTSLDDMQEHIASKVDDAAYDSVKTQQVVDEMVKRHESMMNLNTNPISTALTSFGFVFHLGLSPASALVNLSQTALVAYPVMGAKWGFGKASAALLAASRQAAGNKNDIRAILQGDELTAYDEAVRRGVIDVTMAHDLAGISQGEDAKMSAKLRPVMKWASFLFHHAEKFNRQVTFVAAYRLARATGVHHQTAFDESVKATYDGHFDYSAGNRPRVMQGNVAKVVFLFKQYSQNMIYTLTRNAQQAIKAETPEGRSEARKALSGLLVSHAMAAGVFGLPLVGMLLSAASMIGGDDDEPWDAKVALQNMLADSFGQKAAEVFAHGLSRLTPWDISGRVGLDRLLLPDIQEGLEGTRAAESWAAQALGPVAGIGINMAKGLSEMANGDYARGLESMMPTAVRGPLKAYRYETEGNIDKSGVAINDEVGTAGVVGQALGFSPSEARLAQEGKSTIYSADKAIQTRRSNLLRQFSLAQMAGDQSGITDARKDIVHFNQKNPNVRVTQPHLVASVKARQKRINQAKMGVYLPSKRQDAMEAGRFAAVE